MRTVVITRGMILAPFLAVSLIVLTSRLFRRVKGISVWIMTVPSLCIILFDLSLLYADYVSLRYIAESRILINKYVTLLERIQHRLIQPQPYCLTLSVWEEK